MSVLKLMLSEQKLVLIAFGLFTIEYFQSGRDGLFLTGTQYVILFIVSFIGSEINKAHNQLLNVCKLIDRQTDENTKTHEWLAAEITKVDDRIDYIERTYDQQIDRITEKYDRQIDEIVVNYSQLNDKIFQIQMRER